MKETAVSAFSDYFGLFQAASGIRGTLSNK